VGAGSVLFAIRLAHIHIVLPYFTSSAVLASCHMPHSRPRSLPKAA
jgi:hypothetical protein